MEFENYTGKYAKVDYPEVKRLLKACLPEENYKLFIKEDGIYTDSIHMKAMKQAYELYEYYQNTHKPGSCLYKTVF